MSTRSSEHLERLQALVVDRGVPPAVLQGRVEERPVLHVGLVPLVEHLDEPLRHAVDRALHDHVHLRLVALGDTADALELVPTHPVDQGAGHVTVPGVDVLVPGVGHAAEHAVRSHAPDDLIWHVRVAPLPDRCRAEVVVDEHGQVASFGRLRHVVEQELPHAPAAVGHEQDRVPDFEDLHSVGRAVRGARLDVVADRG